jgi:hypothetical protein
MSYLDKKEYHTIESVHPSSTLYFISFLSILSSSFIFLLFAILNTILLTYRALEKKYQDQVRCLEEDLIRERESMAAKWMQLKNDFERDKATLVNHEIELRRQLEHMEKVL